MPSITIGTMTKRINSTKQTFTAAKVLTDVNLKQPCSMEKPVFEVLKSGLSGFYNYLQWGTWFYWIDDMVYTTNDILTIHCHIDPLATYKTDIQSTSAFTLFANESNWNKLCDDNRLNPEMFKATNSKYFDMFPYEPSNKGCIIMTFVQTASVCWFADWDSQGVVTDCGIHTAILSWYQFKRCMADLTHFDFTGGLVEIQQVIARLMQSTGGGPLMENIQRIIWLPFDYDDLKSDETLNAQYRYGLMLGGALAPEVIWYEIDQTVILRKASSITLDIDQCTDNLRVLRNDRFLSVQVTTPSGYQNLQTERFLYPTLTTDTLYFACTINIADGSWCTKISINSNYADTLASFSGNLGVNLKGTIYDGPTTSSMISDTAGRFVGFALTAGVGSVVGGALAGEKMNSFKGYTSEGMKQYATHLSGGVSSETQAQNIMNGISGVFPSSSFNCNAPSGNYGGSASALFLTGTAGRCFIVVTVYAPKWLADLNTAETNYKAYCDRFGYPVNKFMSLSGVSGYVQCVGASVEAAGASESSIATLNSYLNSGLYIE